MADIRFLIKSVVLGDSNQEGFVYNENRKAKS